MKKILRTFLLSIIFFVAISCDSSSSEPGTALPSDQNDETVDGLGAGIYGSLSYGTPLGSYRNITAYSNGHTNELNGPKTSYGYEFQCVEFVNRFYVLALGHQNMVGTGNAVDYFYTSNQKGLARFRQYNNTPPQPGDILCLSGKTFGHIAIIREVNAGKIKIIQQNWTNSSGDSNKQLNLSVDPSGFSITSPSSSYTVEGWLRIPDRLADDRSFFVMVGPLTAQRGQNIVQPVVGASRNAPVELHFKRMVDNFIYNTVTENTDQYGNIWHVFNTTQTTLKSTYQYYAVDLDTGRQSSTVEFTIS